MFKIVSFLLLFSISSFGADFTVQFQAEDNSISTAKVQDGAISAIKIQDSAVSNSKIQDGAITASKIADGSVSDAKISGVSSNKISGLDSAIDARLSARLVVAKAKTATSSIPGSGQPINMNIIVDDAKNTLTTGAGWKFVAPRAGYYTVDFTGWTSGATVNFVLYKNGSFYENIFLTASGAASGSNVVFLNQNDYIDVRTDGSNPTINHAFISVMSF